MTAQTAPEKTEKAEKPVTQKVRANVIKQVFATLGRPDDLYRTDVHLYAGRKARINVWRVVQVTKQKKGGFFTVAEPDLMDQTRIVDSFYLKLDKNGQIVSSSPSIEQKYV